MTTSLAHRIGIAAGLLAIAASALVMPSAGADNLLVESFMNPTVADATAWQSGGTGADKPGWPGRACLTAGGDTLQTPIAGCGLTTPEPAGSGALKLTNVNTAVSGFALYNRALPTTGGLDITFDQAQYGGGGADGISFFLVDGSTNLTQPGASGGGLGYSAGWDGGTGYGTGVDNGLLGIGIDKWGNFSAPGSTGSGCATGSGAGSPGPGRTPNVVAVRGPGNGSAGYCWLGASLSLGSLLTGASRADATVQVHIVIDPSTAANPKVTISMDGTQVLQIDAPQGLLDSTSFKFGFGGSTGAVTDTHEVWNLGINSVIPVPSTTTSTTSTTSTTPTPSTTTPQTTVTTTVPSTSTPTTSTTPEVTVTTSTPTTTEAPTTTTPQTTVTTPAPSTTVATTSTPTTTAIPNVGGTSLQASTNTAPVATAIGRAPTCTG